MHQLAQYNSTVVKLALSLEGGASILQRHIGPASNHRADSITSAPGWPIGARAISTGRRKVARVDRSTWRPPFPRGPLHTPASLHGAWGPVALFYDGTSFSASVRSPCLAWIYIKGRTVKLVSRRRFDCHLACTAILPRTRCRYPGEQLHT